MTSTELERLVRERLTGAGLSGHLDEEQSQFHEFPDGLFAELVLTDASKLLDVERIAREVRESLLKDGTQLEVIVRASWSVKEVHHAGKALSVTPGAFRDAEAFMATLESGKVTTVVQVDVTSAAWEEIEDAARKAKTSLTGVESVCEFVKQFLAFRLSLGGANYWTPSMDRNRISRLDLGPEEVAYLMGRSPVVQGR